MKAGGGDIHDAKAKLRHSSIKLTSEDERAESMAAVVPRARKAVDGASAHASLTQETPEA